MPDENECLRDENGNIRRTADGTPLYYEYFTCDVDYSDFDEKYGSRSDREVFEEMLDIGLDIPEDILLDHGFRKVNGSWTCVG
ncbi:MAG: hypothetical protein RBT76_01855 [candidate division Zixibacteria bacterium]|jgi:hypothetical protein|nr:hypothetical protein [candidate division Zixibacteria bacterium]